MKPNDEDVQEMVLALFTLMGSIKRATQRSSAASRLAVLQVIAARPGIRPSDVASELDVNQSSVTRQVQVLEAEEQVVVTPDTQDRRACRLDLTDSGWNTLAELNKIGLDRFSNFVADWDVEEVRELTRLLVKLEESKAEVARQEAAIDGRS